MKGKAFKTLGAAVFAIAVLVVALTFLGSVPVSADSGETVRVSTAKELKAAMKKADVGTIIFKTEAYLNVKITANKKSEDKELIINAPNVSITNKAKFSSIRVDKAASYTEAGKGNMITLNDNSCSFSVAKKKKVAELTIVDPLQPTGNLNYFVAKGAKIEKLSILYTMCEMPQWSEYSAKSTIQHFYTDKYGIDETYIYKLDKYGRVISTENTHPEFGGLYTFKYDKNGNLIKSVSSDERGEVVETRTYDKKGRPVKVVSTEEGEVFITYDCVYDKNGNLTKYVITNAGEDTYTYELNMEYDSKNRIITRINTNNSPSKSVYTYDKNGFRTQTVTTYDEGFVQKVTYNYEYNKKGDLVKSIWTAATGKLIYEYEYNDLGEVIKETHTDSDGDVHVYTY